MGAFVANKLVKLLIAKGIQIKNARILILGITFKENCPDIRNTKIVDIRAELLEFGCRVDILDPWAINSEVSAEFGFDLVGNVNDIDLASYQGVILGVAHSEFSSLNIRTNDHCVIYDVKGMLPAQHVDDRL